MSNVLSDCAKRVNQIYATSKRLLVTRDPFIVLENYVDRDRSVRYNQDSYSLLLDIFKALCCRNPDFEHTITIDILAQHVMNIILRLADEDRKCVKEDILNLENSIKDIPIKEFEVFTELHHVDCPETPLSLKQFCIYHKGKDIAHIHSKHGVGCFEDVNDALNRLTSLYIIGYTTSARCLERAYANSELKFAHIANFLTYIAKKKDWHFNPMLSSIRKSPFFSKYALSNTCIGFGNNREALDNLNLVYRITKKEITHWKSSEFRLLDIINKIDHSDYEKRILQLLHWLTKAQQEKKSPVLVFNCCIAVEALLTPSGNKNQIDGLTTFFAESVSFIIGRNQADRISIYKRYKEIYNIRSQVAHGVTSVKADQKIATDCLGYLYRLVDAVLTNKRFSSASSTNDLLLIVEKMKFR